MKKIEAVFTRNKLNDVRSAMSKFGLQQFVASEIKANLPEQTQGLWSGQWHTDFCPKLRLEVIVDDEIAAGAANAILRAARTRHAADARVMISRVGEVVAETLEPTKKRAKHPMPSASSERMSREYIQFLKGSL